MHTFHRSPCRRRHHNENADDRQQIERSCRYEHHPSSWPGFDDGDGFDGGDDESEP